MAPRRSNEIAAYEQYEEDQDYHQNQREEEDSYEMEDNTVINDLAQRLLQPREDIYDNILDDEKNSTKKKKKTSLKHFDEFLFHYWPQMRPGEEAPRLSQV